MTGDAENQDDPVFYIQFFENSEQKDKEFIVEMVKKGDLKKRAKKVADEGKKKDEKKEDEEMEISSDECVEQDSKSSPKMDVCPKKKEPIN